ncbi:ANK superfamily domain protein [Acidianus hospitalis W1]|uniref:ANK superfamily domain protein n=1 Tax=Acidianus hospitalis (strain W1) TaxID=933801 RepID=F4B6X1_ACIHW|nr:ankyrin repeat domain-containing protein [Acidianus hospitalis]AEE94664.1 ANK superfamily domain protein [Acidianus hospitalis W1]
MSSILCSKLHSAVEYGNLLQVKTLLALHCNPNVKDKSGYAPLHYASESGHTDVVKVVLEHGADPNIKDKFGKSPLLYASKKGNNEIAGKSRYERVRCVIITAILT